MHSSFETNKIIEKESTTLLPLKLKGDVELRIKNDDLVNHLFLSPQNDITGADLEQ